jgi:endo-1,4-beta-xylanase
MFETGMILSRMAHRKRCAGAGMAAGLNFLSVFFVFLAAGNAIAQLPLQTDFEDGTMQGWSARGTGVMLANTVETANTGFRSLKTTGRTASWQGPQYNVTSLMSNGSRYRVSVWVRLAAGEPSSSIRVTVERVLAGGTTYHTVIPNTTVTSGQWVQLTAYYDYAFNHDTLTLYVESDTGTPSFYIDDFQLAFTPLQIQTNIASVYQSWSGYFRVGAAISASDISGPHAELLKKHFNSITAGNDMKWATLQPTEGVFNYGPADALVGFAVANNIKVRGHTLVWHQQIPAWVFQDAGGNPLPVNPASKTLVLQRLENHIRAVVPHFGSNVDTWDVVNEVIDPSQADGFRRTQWYQYAGTDYIDRAFLVAHEVAPTAKLIVNDYDTTNPAKRQFLLNLIQNLRSRGVPVDGIGHQMHVNIDYPSADAVYQTINMFSAVGVDNQVTEFDMSVYNNGTQTYTVVPDLVLLRQGYRYRDFFNTFRRLQGKISSVTFWGQADDNTWLSTFPINRLEAPLLFDDQLQAKYAYIGIIAPIRLKKYSRGGRILNY